MNVKQQYLQQVSRVLVGGMVAATALLLAALTESQAQQPLEPLVRTVDMNVGETRQVEMHDGSTAEVELVNVEPVHDSVMNAVRQVRVTVRVNGEEKTIHSGNYHLPVQVGGVQIDSPVTLDYMVNTTLDWWGLEKDARLRLWPEDSPYVWPGTFVYPVDQKWLATLTQYSNEPVLGSPRGSGEIYYHAGIDLGGAEDMVEIYAATDGTVVSARGEVLPGAPEEPIGPRYDVVYIRDARGWYYRYSHLDSIVPELEVGQEVKAGQKIGMLGKEGGSGGWTHLHFHIMARQPSGKWGIQEGYAFLWQAYQRQFSSELEAVARPHKVVRVGEPATLTAHNSWSKHGIAGYEWTFSDGSTATDSAVTRTYERPGMYNETVKVTDAEGNYDYDFATVVVFGEGDATENRPPRMHATFYPTRNIEPGEKVFFKLRARYVTEGYDVVDFGDGTEPFRIKSNINPDTHAKIGYAMTSHRYEEPGDYIVTVQRETSEGIATDKLYVKVREE